MGTGKTNRLMGLLLVAGVLLGACNSQSSTQPRVSTLSNPGKVCGVPIWFGASTERIYTRTQLGETRIPPLRAGSNAILRFTRTCSSKVEVIRLAPKKGVIEVAQVVRDPSGHIIAVRLHGTGGGKAEVIADRSQGTLTIVVPVASG